MVDKGAAPREARDTIAHLVAKHGLHKVVLALMSTIDDNVHMTAKSWQEVALAKHWARCADAMVEFERIVLQELGE